MKKETAVLWLHYHLTHLMQTREWRSKYLHIEKFDELFVEALQMEREQAREHYIAGFNERDDVNAKLWINPLAREYNEKRFEQYYNETYKGGEQ